MRIGAMHPSARILRTFVSGRMAAVALLVALAYAMPARAQHIADSLVLRGLELEGEGSIRLAAPVYRRAISGADPVAALLGLERVYAEIGWTDSLLVPLAEVVGRLPADAAVRAVQLRTLHALDRLGALGEAVQAWSRAAPREAEPYRAYARLLIARGQVDAADSVMKAARQKLGDTPALASVIAQVRAAAGRWLESADAWRTALVSEPWLPQAAAHTLAPTPAERREAVRATFMNAPIDAAARLALAGLEARWGSAAAGWNALRDLAADSAAAAAWITYGELAELDGRWAQARVAFERALEWRASDALRLRAAAAAQASGDPAGAIALAPWPAGPVDSQHVATDLLPLHVMALAQLRRPHDAMRLVAAFDGHLPPGMRIRLVREVAMGWVRQGNLREARATLATPGGMSDSSVASGWLALYEGDARTARAMLGQGDERSADIALALGVLSRFREPTAPEVGRAFLVLAQGDTAAAALRFADAARATPRAASLLLLTAARLHLTAGDTARAMTTWGEVATAHPETPEAPEAMLHRARMMLVQGDRPGALQQLERLVLAYPASALVPVARRELESARPSPGQGR